MHRITLAACLLLFGFIQIGFSLDYEVNEEEPIQPNRLDEANSNFQCSSDGYFADVTYGCQFYHVCENSNSPYDKPSFVKHTFSCVNGTVFNQMSFTCTRYEDSIPCEVSPNYFYLNKRNGDPKAVFLTEEDMVKPTAAKHSPTLSSSSNFIAAPVPSFLPSRPSRQETPVNRQYELSFKDLSDSSTSSSNIINKAKLESAMKNREGDYVSVSESHYGPNSLSAPNAYSRQLQQESQDKQQRELSIPPYEISHKYFPSNIKPGVRYSNDNMDNSKPNLIASNFDRERKLNQSSGKSGDIFRSLLNGYTPSNSKIDQLLVNNDKVLEERQKSSYFLTNSFKQSDNSDFPMPITAYSPKKAAFTPSTFSKMYIESQKSLRYNPPIGRAVSTGDNRSGFNKFSDNSKPQHLKQDMIISRKNLHMYENVASNVSPSKSMSVVSSAKYSQARPLSSGDYQELKSSQYVVPSSIRIVEQGGKQTKPSQAKALTNGAQSPVINQIAGYQMPTTTRLQAEQGLNDLNQPVKIAFISDNTNGEQVSDYGNYKVVKEVKGKNLLIDPSLENDPARDNIIAQVLEMLSKYN